MNWIYPKVKNINKILPFIILGAIIASVYGAVHDQISYTISPEYFTEFKFNQFSYINDSLSTRALVSVIGVMATWWFGALCGWFLGRFRYNTDNLETAKKDIIFGFYIIFGLVVFSSITGALLGYLYAYHLSDNHFLGWEEVLEPALLKPFIVVGFTHTLGYIGGFVGIVYASNLMKKRITNISTRPKTV